MTNAQSQAGAKRIIYQIVKGILISLAMAIAVYVFLGFFSGIASSTRFTASLAFLAFGLLSTIVIGINAYLSHKGSSTPES
jgi:hypothetical protein